MTRGADTVAPVRTWSLAGLLLLAGLAAHPSAGARDEACGGERDVGAGTLDEFTWRQLNAIYEEVGDERYGEAFDDLERMLERAGRDTYLQAIVNQALGQVEWARENYESSLHHFERAVELDTLPDQTHFALMYQIAQLYFMENRFDDALARLETWFCEAPPASVTSAAYVLEASIHARREDYAGAVEAIDKAIAMDEDPREDWYLLRLAAHYELEQYPKAAATLEVLIARWPGKKLYWLQLSQAYDRLKRDSQALAVLALAYRRGLLDQQADIAYLSSLYSRAELPYKAAAVLEDGIRSGVVAGSGQHWTLVADQWYAAAELERALAAYGAAGRASEDGDIDLRRAYILVDLERWPEALEALDQALRKGRLDDRRTGEAYLLRGMTQFSLENLDQAATDWERAGRYESARDAARQWLNHLREERRRQAS
jgi:tetratricopeptide (TPR) repeat protein